MLISIVLKRIGRTFKTYFQLKDGNMVLKRKGLLGKEENEKKKKEEKVKQMNKIQEESKYDWRCN